jgi:hypothetical protein
VQANTIPQGALRVVIGVRNVPDHIVGSVDALSIDTGTGVTTYDFEPGTAPTEKDSLVLQKVSGNVVVGGSTLSAGSKSIKLGTFIDATHGQVTLTSASDAHGSYQTGLFYGGKFKTRQRGSARPITETYLVGKIGPCNTNGKKTGKASAAAKKKRRSRHLWGDAHGNFRTVGKSSSASARGTKWLVKDTCQGTTTTVVRGKVLVRDFATNGRHIVTAGHSFTAPPK